MSIHRSLAVFQRAIAGAFHEYVRGVFAEHSTRAGLLRASRMRWLQGLAGTKLGVRISKFGKSSPRD